MGRCYLYLNLGNMTLWQKKLWHDTIRRQSSKIWNRFYLIPHTRYLHFDFYLASVGTSAALLLWVCALSYPVMYTLERKVSQGVFILDVIPEHQQLCGWVTNQLRSHGHQDASQFHVSWHWTNLVSMESDWKKREWSGGRLNEICCAAGARDFHEWPRI